MTAIQHRARRAVAEAIALGWEGPPFDMEVLASLRRLKLVVRSLGDSKREGLWMGATIILRPGLHKHRRPYVIAHEIVHSLLGKDQATTTKSEAGLLERVCQAGAAELLLPFHVMAGHCNGVPVCTSLIDSVEAAFGVSFEAAGRRCLELCSEPALFIVAVGAEHAARWGVRTIIGPAQLRISDLQVVRAYPSPSWTEGTAGLVGLPVPRTSVIQRSFSRATISRKLGATFRGEESWHIGCSQRQLTVEAAPRPAAGRPSAAIAVMQHSGGQATLFAPRPKPQSQ